MLKWVGRILYVMVISLLSLQIYSYAYYSKLQEYYNENVAEYVDDDALFLNGVNTLMGIDYYRESPILYEYIKDEGDFQISVKVFAIGINSDQVYYDGLMIFVNNITIIEDGVELIDPVIKINVELDQNTLLVGEEYKNRGSIYFDSTQPFAYYNVPVLFLFDADDYLKVHDTHDFSNVTRIEVEYSNRVLDGEENFIYNEIPLFLATNTPVDDGAQNKDGTLSIDPDVYRLRELFSDGIPSEEQIATYNLNDERGNMNPYNWIIWRTMVIYVLIVIILTYFLFFHKFVKEYYKTKNYGKRSGDVDTIDAQPIFRDIEYKDKDGR